MVRRMGKLRVVLRSGLILGSLVLLSLTQASASENLSFARNSTFPITGENRLLQNTNETQNRLRTFLEARGLPKSHLNLVPGILNNKKTRLAQTSEAGKNKEKTDDLLLEADDGDKKGEDDLLLETEGQPSDESDSLLLETDDGDKKGEDDLLLDESEGETKKAASEPVPKARRASTATDTTHIKLFTENRYPSANSCAACHPKQYKEWSVSQHAYAQLSPVYLSLSNKINQLANGSNGDFCLRCHSPVGANLGETPSESNLDRNPTSREGITCVVCHRINKNYNKASGRLALVEGPLTSVIFGPKGNHEMRRILSKPEEYRVVTDPKEKGRQIHNKAKLFKTISTPIFCGTCHDVTLFNGFRLEEAFSEYRMSPAAAQGITCQDCHMGKIQGKVSGYAYGPAAVVGDVPTKNRKLANHLFSGPDYSVIHPGIFPQNVEAAEFKTLREWLKFNVAAGWGTDRFEDNISENFKFPKAWESIDDRYDAREILNKQFELLEYARVKRLEVLRNGYILGKIITDRADTGGIVFRVQVKNGTNGHNVPTGFTGERLVWLDVTVRDREGKIVFRSGDRDPNGDLKDGHSSYVSAGKLPLDKQLFSLQSLFVTQNGRGGEIEHVIPIPFPVTALPRVLPSPVSLIFTGEPPTERNHKKGIEPLGQRWATYTINPRQLTGNGPYRATIKLISQPAPVNLLIAMQSVGFDYGITPKQAGQALVAGAQVLWHREIKFDTRVNPAGLTTSTGSDTRSAPSSVFDTTFSSER
jgi:Cytochrome c554 and c-prime